LTQEIILEARILEVSVVVEAIPLTGLTDRLLGQTELCRESSGIGESFVALRRKMFV